ncbi:MAG: twin-arginine translocase subunit TatC [Gammaproteobacteria bacterium]|nr:twin-arginine translocase subunit TatC [Gammaproteobacteria bacterium]
MSTADESTEDLAEGTLMSHLTELRRRLFIVVGALFLVFLLVIPFSGQLLEYLADPLTRFLDGGEIQAIKPASPLTAQVSLAFYAALFITMPLTLLQLWAFVAPGLYRKEKRFAVPLIVSSIVLFFAGLSFAYYVVLPLIFGFIASFASPIVDWKPDIAEYISFVMMIVLVFGLAFETPIATVLTVWTGLTTPEKLGKARPYVFLGAFVVGMLLTPPDVISQTVLAIPVYLLYELGIIMSKLFKPKAVK